MALLQFLHKHLFNNVRFGIGLMVAIAVYTALGSGFPGVREAFEMNELEFFSAWPLKLLMALLVANLAVVTWTRIPFTPPRYGVWMIHVGIITLIGGLALYYGNKVEGMTRIPVNGSVDHFYETAKRALYVKVDGQLAGWHELDELPRFKGYADELGNAGKLKIGRHAFEPFLVVRDAGGEAVEKPLAEVFKWDQPLTVRVVGYWPYATVETGFEQDASAKDSAVRLIVPMSHAGHDHPPDATHGSEASTDQSAWLMGSDPSHAVRMLGDAEIEHRVVADGQIDRLAKAVGSLHQLEYRVGDTSARIDIEPGRSYELGVTGYRISVESFDPAWRTMKGDIVQLLTLMVESPALKFRRQLIAGREAPTDWKLDDPGSGPMGKRQTEPLDGGLVTVFRFADADGLSPVQGSRKYTILTDLAGGITAIETGLYSPSSVIRGVDGSLELPVQPETRGPMVGASTSSEPLVLRVERVDGVRKVERVEPVPSAQRDRNMGQSGAMQVVRLEVARGDWKQTLTVPFAQEAVEAPWIGPTVRVPGTGVDLQFQLGDLWRPLPTEVKLAKFDLVPYDGGDMTRNSIFRDFRSTLEVKDPLGKNDFVGVAAMNSPVYIDVPSGLPVVGKVWPFTQSWLMFQAQWDAGSPDKPRWTVLGVGNRPGVWVMTLGSALMLVGLLWAFYLKPVLIRRAKERALRKAMENRFQTTPATAPAVPSGATAI